MADDTTLVLLASSPTFLYFAKWLFDRFVTKADKREEKEIEDRDTKLDQVLSSVTKLERDFALQTERQTAQSTLVSEAKARIDGVSANHGPRIAALEEKVARLDEHLRTRAKR